MNINSKKLIEVIKKLSDRKDNSTAMLEDQLAVLSEGEFFKLAILAKIHPVDDNFSILSEFDNLPEIKDDETVLKNSRFDKWPEGKYLFDEMQNQLRGPIYELLKYKDVIEDSGNLNQTDALHRLDTWAEIFGKDERINESSKVYITESCVNIFPEIDTNNYLVIGMNKEKKKSEIRNIPMISAQTFAQSPLETFEQALNDGKNLVDALDLYLKVLKNVNGLLPIVVRNDHQLQSMRELEYEILSNTFSELPNLVSNGKLNRIFEIILKKEKEAWIEDYDQQLPLAFIWSILIRAAFRLENNENHSVIQEDLLNRKKPFFSIEDVEDLGITLNSQEAIELFRLLRSLPPNCFVTIFDRNEILNNRRIDNAQLKNWLCGVKDVFCLAQTTAGSAILRHFNASFSATVVRKLQEAGAIFPGKTNCDEFALGSSNETSAFKPTPSCGFDRLRVAGGSSGGSASAVRAGLVRIALGSDTAGSIRIPAAYCGVVGWKPSYGVVSRFGLLALSMSMDVVGLLARNVDDCIKVATVIIGEDKLDETTKGTPHQDYERLVDELKDRKWKVGVPIEYFLNVNHDWKSMYKDLVGTKNFDAIINFEKEVLNLPEAKKLLKNEQRLDRFKNTIPDYWNIFKDILEKIEKIGWEWELVSLPHTWISIPSYFCMSRAELASSLHRFDGTTFGERQANFDLKNIQTATRHFNLGVQPKLRILMGIHSLRQNIDSLEIDSGKKSKNDNIVDFLSLSKQARKRIKDDFEKVFKNVDVLLTPPSNQGAAPYGGISDSVAQQTLDDLTVPANHAGVPAITIPWGQAIDKSDPYYTNVGDLVEQNNLYFMKTTVSIQVIAPRFEDARLFAVAKVLERLRNGE